MWRSPHTNAEPPAGLLSWGSTDKKKKKKDRGFKNHLNAGICHKNIGCFFTHNIRVGSASFTLSCLCMTHRIRGRFTDTNLGVAAKNRDTTPLLWHQFFDNNHLKVASDSTDLKGQSPTILSPFRLDASYKSWGATHTSDWPVINSAVPMTPSDLIIS